MRKIYFLIPLFLLLIFHQSSPQSVPSNEIWKDSSEFPISKWLKLGPFRAYLPSFHKDRSKGFTVADLLEYENITISRLNPKENTLFVWHDRTAATWQVVEGGEKGIELKKSPHYPSLVYLGVYVDVLRWLKVRVSCRTSQLLSIYLDGRKVGNKKDTRQSRVAAELKLERGTHLLLLKTVYDPHSQADWNIFSFIKLESEGSPSDISLSISPTQKMNISHLLDTPRITGLAISPQGNMAALTLRKSLPPSNETESWVEIYSLPERRLIHTYRGGMKISGLRWVPGGKRFTYTTHKNSEASIWLVDLEAGTSTPLVEKVKNLENHIWSPDGTFLIYSVTEKPDNRLQSVKRFRNLADREPGWRNRTYLYKLTLPDRARERLTTGELSSYFQSISPDGRKLLFTRSIIDYTERPYQKTELYSLNLTTLEAELVWEGKWFRHACWDPRGEKILILGGPSAFGDLGQNIIKGTLPNEYDTQAYLYNPEEHETQPLTRNFNPSINQAAWSAGGDSIYFLTTDRSYRHLYRYNLNKKTFSLIDSGVEVIEFIDFARNKPLAIYTGSSASMPQKSFVIDLKKQEYHLLSFPGKENFKDVKLGKVERWTFRNKHNIEIEGRIYYPPDFDPGRKYPCLVYYYGGTSPVTREFGGRYPKNLYAAKGYVVYVLQPSGAIGFGQKFSAFHVNDWGMIVADEIIDGVKKFLDAHPFVETKQVGCIGASYGGFITMLLLTRTDIFATAVAHAGISSISSYWGEGYWGYAYSAYAAPNSFPWNRKDIFVNQSPLFNADKITTPLLLLHGSEDTNVPPGESTQLFTALKILGKEGEYIQILGENHHILTYNKRIMWTKTILAWFDRYLKNQPEWWNELYHPE
ncbi:MAG: prolyl oligopeptidase family serine peptidase [Candidatus Aminicenantales bacterium]